MKTLALASLVLAFWLAGSARAQPAGGDDEAAATALVEQAARAYDQNQLDEALQLLSRAYALSPRPSILYNQAQVLRAKDDCPAALDAYRRFIDTTAPDDPNRERALRRRDEMQACADRQAPPPASVKLTPAEPAPPVATPPAVVLSATPRSVNTEDHPAHRRRALRAGGWTLIGVGAIAAGAAAVFAWKSHNLQNDLNTQVQQNLEHGNPWTEQSQYGEMRTNAARSWWSAGIAALAAGGGATILFVSRPPALAGESHAALFGWTGSF